MTFAQVGESTVGGTGSLADDLASRRSSTPSERAAVPGTAFVPRQAAIRSATDAGAPLSDEAWVRQQRVTVLMATYNRAQYIEEALDSLLKQTRVPDQVIVVDDGSTDETRMRLQRYGARLHYVAQANGGKATAINRGLKEATGDWIWVFDDDDAALPDGLEKLLYALAKQRDADFAYGGQVTGSSGDDGRIVPGQVVLPPEVPSQCLFGRSLRNIPFLLPAALVRRARFAALRGFDERYARSQDYEFLLRLLVDARGVRVPQPIFIWRSHDGPRGPAHVRHDAALRERVWMEVGGRLGRELRQRLPLVSYLQSGDGKRVLYTRDLRRAVLERMAVMASKGLVREMLVDLHSAASVHPKDGPTPLDADEARACWEVGNFPFFQMRLLDAPDRIVKRMAATAVSPTGKAMLARIARGLLHAARHSDRPAAQRRVLLRCALRLFRACGTIRSATAYLPARRH